MAAFVRPTFEEEEKEKKKDWFGLNYEGTSDRVITRSGAVSYTHLRAHET